MPPYFQGRGGEWSKRQWGRPLPKIGPTFRVEGEPETTSTTPTSGVKNTHKLTSVH